MAAWWAAPGKIQGPKPLLLGTAVQCALAAMVGKQRHPKVPGSWWAPRRLPPDTVQCSWEVVMEPLLLLGAS